MRLAATRSSIAAGSAGPPVRGAAPEGRSFMCVLTNAGVRGPQTSEFARGHQVGRCGTGTGPDNSRISVHPLAAEKGELRRPKMAQQRLPVAIDFRLRHNVENPMSRM